MWMSKPLFSRKISQWAIILALYMIITGSDFHTSIADECSAALAWAMGWGHLAFSLVFYFQTRKSGGRPSIIDWHIFFVGRNSQNQCNLSLVQEGYSFCSLIYFPYHTISCYVLWLKLPLFSLKCSAIEGFASRTWALVQGSELWSLLTHIPSLITQVSDLHCPFVARSSRFCCLALLHLHMDYLLDSGFWSLGIWSLRDSQKTLHSVHIWMNLSILWKLGEC